MTFSHSQAPECAVEPDGNLIDHFAYRNRVDIAANDDVVQVFGNESAGRYYELKDAKTGETVGHKIFGQSGKSSTNDHETGT